MKCPNELQLLFDLSISLLSTFFLKKICCFNFCYFVFFKQFENHNYFVFFNHKGRAICAVIHYHCPKTMDWQDIENALPYAVMFFFFQFFFLLCQQVCKLHLIHPIFFFYYFQQLSPTPTKFFCFCKI